jgi:hypothetical protein
MPGRAFLQSSDLQATVANSLYSYSVYCVVGGGKGMEQNDRIIQALSSELYCMEC